MTGRMDLNLKFEDQANSLFKARFNCAQSTFGAFAEHLGLDLKAAIKIATPFGGGMGRNGHLCGAVSGAIMALGLAEGVSEYDKEKETACYDLVRQFIDRFSAQHGSLTCPGLLGVDIGDPEALQQARDQDLFHTLCPHFVNDATRIAAELLGLEP